MRSIRLEGLLSKYMTLRDAAKAAPQGERVSSYDFTQKHTYKNLYVLFYYIYRGDVNAYRLKVSIYLALSLKGEQLLV